MKFLIADKISVSAVDGDGGGVLVPIGRYTYAVSPCFYTVKADARKLRTIFECLFVDDRHAVWELDARKARATAKGIFGDAR